MNANGQAEKRNVEGVGQRTVIACFDGFRVTLLLGDQA